MKQLIATCALLVCVGATFAVGSSMNAAKTVICHIPPGNPDNPQTIEVADASLPAHFAHGDTVGECASLPD